MTFNRLLGTCALVLLTSSGVRADIVSVTMNLNTPSTGANRLSLGFLDGSTTSDMFGTITADININRTTGVISSLVFTGGLISTTNWTINTQSGLLLGTDIVATMGTTLPAPGSTVTSGTFDATEQFLNVNGGTAALPAVGFSQDFGTDPFDIPGTGVGSITSTLNNGVFNLAFSMAIDHV